jgi:hypothetical protein
MNLPPDVLRDKRMTLDEWASSFTREQESKEDRLLRCRAAKNLINNPTAVNVVAELEALAVRGIANCSAVEVEKAESHRHLLLGIRHFWGTLKAMAQDAELADRENKG